jgi:histidinol dehydrogenase
VDGTSVSARTSCWTSEALDPSAANPTSDERRLDPPIGGAVGTHLTVYAMRTSGADTSVCRGRAQALGTLAFSLIHGLKPVDMLIGAGDADFAEAHVLPTLRGARFTRGLWVGKFLKTCTWRQLTEEGTGYVVPAVETISHADNFAGHGLTAAMSLEWAGV